MSKKCVACGAELADDALFCTECGTKAEVITDTVKVFGQAPAAPGAATVIGTTSEQPVAAQPAPQAQPTAQVNYTAPAAPAAPAPKQEIAPVVKTAAFFWLDVLYCLPVIGFVACIIICAAAKNPNIRHHAASKLIEILVALVISIIVTIICVVAVKQAGVSMSDLINSYGNIYY